MKVNELSVQQVNAVITNLQNQIKELKKLVQELQAKVEKK